MGWKEYMVSLCMNCETQISLQIILLPNLELQHFMHCAGHNTSFKDIVNILCNRRMYILYSATNFASKMIIAFCLFISILTVPIIFF